MSRSFSYDVFLSHNSADKPRVRRLAQRLQKAGLKVWLDEWEIKLGDIIASKVDEGLEQSRALVLCISPAALASGWVALERSTAIHRDPANKDRRFIPLLLEDCDLPDTLRRYKYLDYRLESGEAWEDFLTACRQEGSESVPPTPPLSKEKKRKSPGKRASFKPSSEPEGLAVWERTLAGHTERVMGLASSPDGEWTASASEDGTVRIWDLRTGECRATLGGHSGGALCVAFQRDGRLLSGSYQGEIFLTDIPLGTPQMVRKLTGSNIWQLAYTKDGRILSGGGRGQHLSLWDPYGSVTTWMNNVWVSGMAMIEKFGLVASGGHDERVVLTALGSGEEIAELRGHESPVYGLAISPDERSIISGSADKTIKIWDVETRNCVGTLEGHTGTVHKVAVSPDGALIASMGNMNDNVRVWDSKSGACLQVLEIEANSDNPHREFLSLGALAFSPDGLKLLVGNNTGSIFVYRLNTIRSKPSAEATRRYVNAKVVLIGEGTVGKTSLAHRLMEDQYVVKDRTHGMNVWRLDLPLPPDDTLEREALLWDLAGQEDYRLIHQLFLEETALALMLVNPQKDDPFAEAGDWLKALKSAANARAAQREAARLLVFSQIDVGGMKLGDAKIDRFREQHGFAGWLGTSAKTGENCSDAGNGGQPSRLKQLISESIPWDKLPWTSTPRLLAELKDAVMSMRDETDIRLLRFSELAQRLELALPGEEFTEADVRTAVTLLANHGLARVLRFGDLVLLRPDLINGYAGAVIRAARAHTDEIGCVLEEKIYRPDFDFTGVERLKHRPDEELLLRALVQTFLDHSLCIAEDTPHGRHLVFPSQYRREKDLPHEPDVFVSYSFSGEWQTVWTTLVVRLWYSQEFAHRELWRNAAEFESARKQTLGLKITKTGDGGARICLYFEQGVSDDLKVIFIEYVHRHLARYACEVTRARRYVCPECGKTVEDLKEVRRRMDAGKKFIICQGCDEKVPFEDFIEQRLKSDPVARKILAMDETATRTLDTQALEQILIGHMMATAGEAGQIFHRAERTGGAGDGELEFRDDDGKPGGKRIRILLKIDDSRLRSLKTDEGDALEVVNDSHLKEWTSGPADVWLVLRQTDNLSGRQVIRWMNLTDHLKARADKTNRRILFRGADLDMRAVWEARDAFFPRARTRK